MFFLNTFMPVQMQFFVFVWNSEPKRNINYLRKLACAIISEFSAYDHIKGGKYFGRFSLVLVILHLKKTWHFSWDIFSMKLRILGANEDFAH